MDIKRETLILLFGFKPENNCNKDISWFWEKIENSKGSISENWKDEYEHLIHNWRHSDSIPIDLYLFLKEYYPFAIPYSLFFSYKNEKWESDVKYFRQLSALADKWIKDIFSGESFYELNKEYFAKNDVKTFLTCDWDEVKKPSRYRDFIYHYFNAKINAKKNKLSPDVFTDKFKDCFINPLVINYSNFVCDNQKHFGNREIGDIADFLKNEYVLNALDFDFNTNSWQNLKRLSLEWHNTEQYRVAPFLQNKIDSNWKKSIEDFNYKEEGRVWTIKEITSGKLLNEEGVDMHHCVFSYVDSCIKEYHKIFSLRCVDDNKIDMKKAATLEVDNEMRLIQARGRYNANLDKGTIDIIKTWCEESKINYDNNLLIRTHHEKEQENISFFEEKSKSIKDFVYNANGKTWIIKRTGSSDNVDMWGKISYSLENQHSLDFVCGVSGEYRLPFGEKDVALYKIKCTAEGYEAILVVSENMELVEILGDKYILNKETEEIINIWATENLIKWDKYFEMN